MTACAILVFSTGADLLAERNGRYLKTYDADAKHGRGKVTFTETLHDAIILPDLDAAMAFYRRQSRVQPLRPDGKANRPLTAYPVQFVPVNGAAA